MKKTVRFLEGERVYLRPCEEQDAELVYFGKNDARVRETLFLFAPMTLEQVKEELQSWSRTRETVLFTICTGADDAAVGQTALLRIDAVSRAAVFYIAIYDPAHWARGYGGEATRLMCRYGFDILNLHRIQLHVACDNARGVAAYRRAGFQIEGTLRQAMYHNDRYCDFYVMGMLRQEYYAARNAGEK